METTTQRDGTPAPLPPTERRLPESMGLDDMDTETMLRAMNRQDLRAVHAVHEAITDLAELVQMGTQTVRNGHHIHYFGAGTSGRLGVLDAAELYPTFNTAPGTVIGHIAGGMDALTNAMENAEDATTLSPDDEDAVEKGDLVIGITASGATPYVAAALQSARGKSAATALICCNPHPPCSRDADLTVVLDTGEEFITGSTRLKAGTAEKLALNSFSTAVMVQCGKTWSNLMVCLNATNDKLRDRARRIMREATGLDEAEADASLLRASGDLRVALVSHFASIDADAARARLAEHQWSVTYAVNAEAGDTRALGTRPRQKTDNGRR